MLHVRGKLINNFIILSGSCI